MPVDDILLSRTCRGNKRRHEPDMEQERPSRPNKNFSLAGYRYMKNGDRLEALINGYTMSVTQLSSQSMHRAMFGTGDEQYRTMYQTRPGIRIIEAESSHNQQTSNFRVKKFDVEMVIQSSDKSMLKSARSLFMDLFVHHELYHNNLLHAHVSTVSNRFISMYTDPVTELATILQPEKENDAYYPLPLNVAQYVTASVLNGINFLQGLGIAHNEVSPRNVVLTRNGTVRLTNFGSATVDPTRHGFLKAFSINGEPQSINRNNFDCCPEPCSGLNRTSDVFLTGLMLLTMSMPKFNLGCIFESMKSGYSFVLEGLQDEFPDVYSAIPGLLLDRFRAFLNRTLTRRPLPTAQELLDEFPVFYGALHNSRAVQKALIEFMQDFDCLPPPALAHDTPEGQKPKMDTFEHYKYRRYTLNALYKVFITIRQGQEHESVFEFHIRGSDMQYSPHMFFELLYLPSRQVAFEFDVFYLTNVFEKLVKQLATGAESVEKTFDVGLSYGRGDFQRVCSMTVSRHVRDDNTDSY